MIHHKVSATVIFHKYSPSLPIAISLAARIPCSQPPELPCSQPPKAIFRSYFVSPVITLFREIPFGTSQLRLSDSRFPN